MFVCLEFFWLVSYLVLIVVCPKRRIAEAIEGLVESFAALLLFVFECIAAISDSIATLAAAIGTEDASRSELSTEGYAMY